jgi:hypothetical protein
VRVSLLNSHFRVLVTLQILHIMSLFDFGFVLIRWILSVFGFAGHFHVQWVFIYIIQFCNIVCKI